MFLQSVVLDDMYVEHLKHMRDSEMSADTKQQRLEWGDAIFYLNTSRMVVKLSPVVLSFIAILISIIALLHK